MLKESHITPTPVHRARVERRRLPFPLQMATFSAQSHMSAAGLNLSVLGQLRLKATPAEQLMKCCAHTPSTPA